MIILGREDEAIQYIEEAIKKDPNYKFAQYSKGLCLNKWNNEYAITYFETAIKIDPSYAIALDALLEM